jgi:hypothetical protein
MEPLHARVAPSCSRLQGAAQQALPLWPCRPFRASALTPWPCPCPSKPPPLPPLQENAFNYDKGVLAEILEPIMGKGLIPADLDTWRVRRKAIVPGFHLQYYQAMAAMFARCAHWVQGGGERRCAVLHAALRPRLLPVPLC